MDIKRVLNIYWKFIRPYLFNQILVLFLIILSSFFTLYLPYIFKMIIDNLLTTKSIELLLRNVFYFVICYLLQSLFQILKIRKLSYIRNRLDYDLTLELLKKILNFDVHFYHKVKIGELIQRVMNEVTEVKNIFSDLLISFITQLVNFFIVLLIMFKLNMSLTFLVLAAVPFIVAHLMYFNPKFKKTQTEIKIKTSLLTNSLQDYLQGIDVIKSHRKESYVLYLLLRKLHFLILGFCKAVYLQVLNGQVMSLINLVIPVLLLIFGGINVIQGEMSIGSFVAIYTYINKLYSPIRSIVNINIQLQKAFAALERYVDIIEHPIVNKKGVYKLNDLKKGITVNNVSYIYPNGEVGIENLSFELNKGEIIALIGRNGVGKSTILNILQGIYLPTTGTVLIDGVPLNNVCEKSLKKLIGFVPQNSYLFNTTIQKNITLGWGWNKNIEKLAKVLNIHDYILSLKEGYQTKVERNGEDFSGGQKQKITILRALYNDPVIILLDESTSAIDNSSEKAFFEYLRNIKGDKLIVFVTHNKDLLKYADRIIDLDNQSIKKKGGEYASNKSAIPIL
ncbi:ABC transporter ATP-binding protein [Caloranaerobacter sp. DY30410]|uniref:ABC transporter ATP-binding protein n=1 Tax=Caloranaerobacter sp. DY30410 TaxID=3238305 RepID=UPI003D074377